MSMGHHPHRTHGNPDDLAGYLGKLEDPGRAAWQMPDAVLRALELAPDQIVCDVGAGPGYFSLPLARVVERVFAVEVEPRLLEVLRQRIADSELRNLTPVLGLPDDPLVPRASFDRILMVDTYHHFPDGVGYLRRLAESLKPGGRIAIIDFHKRELPVGPPPTHKVAREELLLAATRAGLSLVDEPTFLPHQYFLIFESGKNGPGWR